MSRRPRLPQVDETMQRPLSLAWPDTHAPGRYVYRHRICRDEFWTCFATTRALADQALRRRMRAPHEWELVEAVAFIPPSLRQKGAPTKERAPV